MTFKQRHRRASLSFIICLLYSLLASCEAGTEHLSNLPSNAQSAGARTILRVYDECTRAEGGFVPCLKKKAISFIDRIAPIDAITVADGIKLVRLPGAASGGEASAVRPSSYSENELESALPRSGSDRDAQLTDMLVERLSHFFNGHSLQVSFPKLTSDELGRGLEEGRGKMKKMMGMMMMGMAMKMMGMIPIAMGMLYILAGKALIISKIALLLAGIIGLKKLMSGKSSGGSSGWSSGGGGGGGGGWSSGGGGGGGGWDRRSLNEAQELAYRAHSRQQQQLHSLQI
ncbi:uncharacterized protein LOC115621979 [Scaptodrosophila lebanonensis]|uniref:Uncharacterized protein LOC115621979 n=1 Tax=Drosophila lebanonensis TaxID=7225 RepID=A0A6J2T450_DROLE|nr:uncharacterized protein LOC115621979 [Scaptodrosophila lebanonensis]